MYEMFKYLILHGLNIAIYITSSNIENRIY